MTYSTAVNRDSMDAYRQVISALVVEDDEAAEVIEATASDVGAVGGAA